MRFDDRFFNFFLFYPVHHSPSTQIIAVVAVEAVGNRPQKRLRSRSQIKTGRWVRLWAAAKRKRYPPFWQGMPLFTLSTALSMGLPKWPVIHNSTARSGISPIDFMIITKVTEGPSPCHLPSRTFSKFAKYPELKICICSNFFLADLFFGNRPFNQLVFFTIILVFRVIVNKNRLALQVKSMTAYNHSQFAKYTKNEHLLFSKFQKTPLLPCPS